MSRQPYQWKQEQLKLAERMWRDDVTKHCMAEELGVSYSTLQFHLEDGELKHLPKRKIGGGKKLFRQDDERRGVILGVADWKERAKEVRKRIGFDDSDDWEWEDEQKAEEHFSKFDKSKKKT